MRNKRKCGKIIGNKKNEKKNIGNWENGKETKKGERKENEKIRKINKKR